VRFDGRCGHVRARLRGRAGAIGAPVTLSSADGDAEATAAAVNAYGRAAVVFTEWRAHELLLRVATYSRSGWNVATLEQRTQPIWSPRVVVTPNGTTVAMWIDQVDPLRSVRVAVLPANGTWHRPLTLDSADGLGSIGAAAGREDLAAVAWHDSVANEERVRTTVYAHGSWSRVVTLAAGVERLDHVAVGPDAAFIRWRARRFPKQKVEVFQAVRRGSAWAGAEALLRWREQKPRSARAATRAGERMQVLRLPLRLPRRMIELPILMYHRVAPLTQSLPAITRALTVTPQDFAAQMRWLVSHGYHAVTQRQTFDALEHSAPLPTKPIMITFDDGYRDVLSNAAPVLARLHMPATAYVISGRISSSDPSFLTWDDLRALERAGISIGSHTVHHLELPLLPAATAYAELVKSRDTLQQHLGHPVQWFAYPSGRTNSASERLVAEAGYVLAVTTHQGALQRADAPFALRRYRILGTTGVTGLAALLRH
jgi:peptidoglycan/xylan/chitin deacetylase (PgdA/CDA1 family)